MLGLDDVDGYVEPVETGRRSRRTRCSRRGRGVGGRPGCRRSPTTPGCASTRSTGCPASSPRAGRAGTSDDGQQPAPAGAAHRRARRPSGRALRLRRGVLPSRRHRGGRPRRDARPDRARVRAGAAASATTSLFEADEPRPELTRPSSVPRTRTRSPTGDGAARDRPHRGGDPRRASGRSEPCKVSRSPTTSSRTAPAWMPRLAGAQTVGRVPDRGILVGAPHTANRDRVQTIARARDQRPADGDRQAGLLQGADQAADGPDRGGERTSRVRENRGSHAPATSSPGLPRRRERPGRDRGRGLSRQGRPGGPASTGSPATGLPITLAFLDGPSRTVGFGPTFAPDRRHPGRHGPDPGVLRRLDRDPARGAPHRGALASRAGTRCARTSSRGQLLHQVIAVALVALEEGQYAVLPHLCAAG